MTRLFYFLKMKDLLQDLIHRSQAEAWSDKRLLIALSGGVDSMVLAHLLLHAGCTLALAHCNYGLRGADSDADEALVTQWAATHAIPLHVQKFDTKRLLAAQGGNLQDTARRLRYEWFASLLEKEDYELIVTAHHMQDAVETMLYNLFSGTGIAGLHGILARQGQVLRPLLPYAKEDIVAYARAHEIPWREDASNAKSDYTRNKIRNELLPRVQEIFPQAIPRLADNIQRFRDVEMLYQQQLAQYRKKLMEYRGDEVYLAVKKVRACRPLSTILWELLRPFGFTHKQMPDILHLLEAESGKHVFSASHLLLRNRNHLILSALAPEKSHMILIAEPSWPASVHTSHFELYGKMIRWEKESQVPDLPTDQAMIDSRQLTYPLLLRPWKTGDYFYPLGLNKKKKISRFLIDIKMPLHKKEQVWVLESGGRIVWVLGHRTDHRFRIVSNTTTALQLKIK